VRAQGRLTLTAMVSVALTGLSFAAPSHAATYQIPGTIPSSCSVDVTQPILSWIASVPDNSTLSFGNGACYRVDGILELTNRNGLSFEGNGATFRAFTPGDPQRAHWRLIGGSNLSLRNMTIRGAHPNPGTRVDALQWQHGIDLRGARSVDVDHVNIVNPYGDCIYVGRAWDASSPWTRDVHVHDSSCAGAGRQGIAVTAGRDVVANRIDLTRIALNVFNIEPNGTGSGAANVTFRNNQVSAPFGDSFAAVIGSGPVDGVTIADNTLRGKGMYMALLAPVGERRSKITITGNSSDRGHYAAGSAALDFERIDGLTVTGNTIPLSGPNMALASVSRSCNVNVSGNHFPGGVVQSRVSSYSCLDRRSTSTTLQVRRAAKSGARRARGRVQGSRSGRAVIRLERFNRATHRWVNVRTLKPRLSRRGRFATRLRGLEHGRWRARARFRGTRQRAPSRSPFRYFRVR
jgi:hypothetical protein